MRAGRWNNLDREKPCAKTQGPPAEASRPTPAIGESEGPIAAEEAAVVRSARGCLRLGQYQACADLLGPVLEREPDLPGARGLLGAALGGMRDLDGAERELAREARAEPQCNAWRAALLSARLTRGDSPVPQPESNGSVEGPLAELAGAALWLRGQEALRAGNAPQALRRFAESAELFERASPPDARAERLAACYLGQAVSALLAGELEAAQHGFSRLPGREAASGPVLRFARQVYEIAGLLGELDAGERTAAVEPLVELLLRTRLRVAFYDTVRPVSLWWEIRAG